MILVFNLSLPLSLNLKSNFTSALYIKEQHRSTLHIFSKEKVQLKEKKKKERKTFPSSKVEADAFGRVSPHLAVL